MNYPVPPRIVAEVARMQFKSECNRLTSGKYRADTLGKLTAVNSIIPDDLEIMGWMNEARFNAYDYAPRHNLRW